MMRRTAFPRSAYGGAIEREWDTKDAYNRYKQGLDGYTPKDAYKLEEAVGKMMYFYYIAGVRENLKMASTELSHYGKNYDEVLNLCYGRARPRSLASATAAWSSSSSTTSSTSNRRSTSAEGNKVSLGRSHDR